VTKLRSMLAPIFQCMQALNFGELYKNNLTMTDLCTDVLCGLWGDIGIFCGFIL
jgi:hypothetical protein